MIFAQYIKLVAKALFLVLLSMSTQAAKAVPVYSDVKKLESFVSMDLKLKASAASLGVAVNSIDGAVDNFEAANSEIAATLKTLKQYDNLFSKWQLSTDPSTPTSSVYVKNVTDAENGLVNLTNLDKLNLYNLEKNNFDNTDASDNSALQHSQGNNSHEASFKKGILCPGDPNSTEKTHITLQYKSCQIINNATAYKIKLSESAQKKQKVIDDAITDVLKKSPITIGDFEARRVALSDLQAFQQTVIDEYDLKAKNVDLQIKIAEEARRYTAEALLVGPAQKSNRPVSTDIVKTTLGFALNALIPGTIPYNE